MGALKVPVASADSAYRSELLSVVQAKIDEHPRSAQAQIGPSEAGACERQVAWKLAFGGASDKPGGWAAAKGTQLHSFLDEAFKSSERRMPDGSQRFYGDMKIAAVSPHINGGTCDLYDRLYANVVDFKLPGEWTMKSVRGGDLSETYYVQASLYGLGLEAMGYPVERVSLLFLPMCGDSLHQEGTGAFYRWWKFDRQVALDTIANVERIKNLLDLVPANPTRVIEAMATKSSFCSGCPAFSGSGDRRATCPGVKMSRSHAKIDPSDPFKKI